MIFEDTYEHSVNWQEYDNKQRKNHKEEETNRTKIVVEAMTINLACIIILLCLFFRYRIAWPWKYRARGRNRTFWYLTRVRCVEPLRYLWLGNNWYSWISYVVDELFVLFQYLNSNWPVKCEFIGTSTLNNVYLIRIWKLSKEASWFKIYEHGYLVSRWRKYIPREVIPGRTPRWPYTAGEESFTLQ